MYVAHLAVGALAFGAVYGSPIGPQDIVPESAIVARDAISYPAPVDLSTPDVPGLALQERQQRLNFRTFAKGSFKAFAAAYAVGLDIWTAAADSCQEIVNNKVVSQGIRCVWQCFEVLWRFAFWYHKLGNGNFEAILNTLAGETKRDGQGWSDWQGHWQNLNQDQQSHVRSLLPDTPGFWLHSMSNGSPDIANSAGFLFAADGSNASTWRHVTNGTHGFVHALTSASSQTAQSRRAVLNFPDDSYSFNNQVAGIKFSYIHPCDSNYDNPPDDVLDELVSDFAQSFLQGGADKYAIEIDESNNPVMYGTLIVEGSGFGNDYEGIDFVPPNTCYDEL